MSEVPLQTLTPKLMVRFRTITADKKWDPANDNIFPMSSGFRIYTSGHLKHMILARFRTITADKKWDPAKLDPPVTMEVREYTTLTGFLNASAESRGKFVAALMHLLLALLTSRKGRVRTRGRAIAPDFEFSF